MGGGNYAYSANLNTPNSPYGNGAVTRILSQTLNTCAGRNYSITADYNFAYVFAGGKCSFTMQYPQGSIAVDSYQSAPRVWHTTPTARFQAVTNADHVEFTLTCSTPGNIEVDSVNITRY